MKRLLVTVSALAAASMMSPTVAFAAKEKAAKEKPAEAAKNDAVVTSAPETADEAPLGD